MLSLFVAAVIGVTIATPTCQYGIGTERDDPSVSPLNECNGYFNGYDNVNTSFEYVCNSTGNGINLVYYEVGDCSGNPVSTTDITSDFSEFDCSLPQCNDSNAAFMEFTEYDNCTTKSGARINLFVDECVEFSFDSAGKYTCNDSPPSFTYSHYSNRDCRGTPDGFVTYKDGCYNNETWYYINKCTKPTNPSLLSS